MSGATRKITVNIPEELYVLAAAHKAINRVDLQDAVTEGLKLYLARFQKLTSANEVQPQLAQ